MPVYLVYQGLGKKLLKDLEKYGINKEEIIRIWEEEDVPDIYRVNGSIVVDLQFVDHRVMIILAKDVVFFVYDKPSKLSRWMRNVLKKHRKFLEDPREFLFHAINMELEFLNELVLSIHKEISRYERKILSSLRKENEDIILKLYESITKLLDARRELTYFYRMLVKLKKFLKEDQLQDLRSSIQETVSLINLSLSTARSLLDVHDKVLSMELNLLIKRLTAISIILAVITIVTGIYGMNFRVIPLAEHPHGFWIINGLMVILFLLMWWWFKKIGWM